MEAPKITDVRRMLSRRNPNADLTATWEQRPRLVTYPTGLRGYRGTVRVEAEGYRPTTMIVERDADGTMVR